jgi:hypothetical protein
VAAALARAFATIRRQTAALKATPNVDHGVADLHHYKLYHGLEGLPTATAFHHLHELVMHDDPWNHTCDSRHALLATLVYLRRALPFDVLAAMFQLGSTETTRRVVWTMVDRLFDASHRDVEGAVRFLFDDALAAEILSTDKSDFPLTAVIDTTVIPMCQPDNIDLARLTMDYEKDMGFFVKFLIVCTPKGRVMHVAGPYKPAGKNADGLVLTDAIVKSPEFLQFARHRKQRWDLDRGFRGCMVPAPPEQLRICIPAFAHADDTPFSAVEVAHNRQITQDRWIIEFDNARIKDYAWVQQPRSVHDIQHAHKVVSVIAFLVNRFYKPPR